MSTGDLIILLLAVAAIPVIINVALIMVFFKGKALKKRSMSMLTQRVVETKDVQEGVVGDYLEKLGYDPDEADPLVKKFSQQRIQIMSKLITAIISEDETKMSETCDDVNELVGAVTGVELKVQAAPELEEGEESREQLQEKVAELKTDNKRLKKEVHKNLKTLNNLFSEYSSMFGEDIDVKDMSAEEILDAMAAFSDRVSESDEVSGDVVIDEGLEPDETNNGGMGQPSEDQIEDADATWEEALAEANAGEPDGDETTISPGVGDDDDEPSWEDAFNEKD